MWDWIEHHGQHCPVPKGLKVDIKFRNGTILRDLDTPDSFSWLHEETYGDIIAWRQAPKMETPDWTKPQIQNLSYKPNKQVGVNSTSSVPNTNSIANTNPKAGFGAAKVPLNLWPPIASAYGSLAFLNGGLKYGYGNYKATPVLASIYIAGALRHFSAWAEGEEFDPVDGMPHLGGALANIGILLEARSVGTLVDDRQISGGYTKELENLNKIAASLHEFHKDKNPRHYTIADNPKEVKHDTETNNYIRN